MTAMIEIGSTVRMAKLEKKDQSGTKTIQDYRVNSSSSSSVRPKGYLKQAMDWASFLLSVK